LTTIGFIIFQFKNYGRGFETPTPPTPTPTPPPSSSLFERVIVNVEEDSFPDVELTDHFPVRIVVEEVEGIVNVIELVADPEA
jgi:hypothetical protein